MDSVVESAFWAAIEKRRRSEKHVLKTVVAMPKVLRRIILDYSRIDIHGICEISDKNPRTKVSHLKITDNDAKLSMAKVHFCVQKSFQEYEYTGIWPCHDKDCEINMPHIAMTIVDNNIKNNKTNKKTFGLTIDTMIEYIETGDIIDNNFPFNYVGKSFPWDILVAITPMLKFLFDQYIWQNVQTPANMRVT